MGNMWIQKVTGGLQVDTQGSWWRASGFSGMSGIVLII